MMKTEYELVTVPTARRSLKKLPKHVKQALVDSLVELQKNPLAGEQLKGDLNFLRSHHMILKRTHYRIAYEVNAKAKHVIIYYTATRENFYKELKRLSIRRKP